MNTQKLLSVERLNVSINDKPILRNISFEIDAGEVVGLVGESGSGKSMTSLALMQLLPTGSKTNGEIFFEDINILASTEKELQHIRGNKISMIFQQPMSSFNPSQRCGNQVTEVIHQHYNISKSEAKSKVLDLFTKVSLKDVDRIFNAYPHELSGGQLQRIMIAIALANNPKLIIADEPTTALDVTVQRSIIDILKEVQRDYGSALLFISHDLGVVRAIADKIIVMKNGEIVEQGHCEDIYNNPKHPYTKGLIACRPPLDKKLKYLPTVQDFETLGEDEISRYLQSLELEASDWQKKYDFIMNNKSILEVKMLSKDYPLKTSFMGKVLKSHKGLDSVSFEIKKGESLGLVGESGSGKSTCGKTIMKLIEPTHGEVIFDGKPIFDINSSDLQKLRSRFQIIFQDPYSSLNPRLKIGVSLIEPLQIHNIGNNNKERFEMAITLLDKVGLKAEHMDRYPHQFSGGQLQRICIARALTLKPDFIVCDESVSALDVSVQATILNLLRSLQDEFNLSYLFISHDISVVKHFCHNVMVLKDGKVVEYGSVNDVLHSPKSAYTANLIDSVLV